MHTREELEEIAKIVVLVPKTSEPSKLKCCYCGGSVVNNFCESCCQDFRPPLPDLLILTEEGRGTKELFPLPGDWPEEG